MGCVSVFLSPVFSAVAKSFSATGSVLSLLSTVVISTDGVSLLEVGLAGGFSADSGI